MKIKEIFKNISYTLSSNLLTLLISALVILVVPKLVGVKEYGYFQLYLFYTTYVGIFPFGWIDGIYLRYGGKNYEDLDKQLFHSQFIMYVVSQCLIAIGIILTVIFFVADPQKKIVLLLTALCLIFFNVRAFVLFILQATNRISEYASITIQDRVIYLIVIVFVLLFGERSFIALAIADLVAKCWTMLYSLYVCRDFVSCRVTKFVLSVRELWLNVSSGIKLLIANFASLLIIGSIRFAIEKFWGVQTFGKVALTLSISSLAMTFVSAISLVLFPILRRSKRSKFHDTYITIRDITLITLLFFLFLYYPIEVILPMWLPKYNESLVYLSVLFPMCFYEGKFELLTNTFMKTLRLENNLLIINCFSVLLSISLIFVNIIFFHKLNAMIFLIIFILAFRSTLGEIIVSKKLNVHFVVDILGENIMAFCFILMAWNWTYLRSFIGYLIIFILYLWTKKNTLKRIFKYIESARR
ncbi:oligosaccharide flippase family protein [Pediococcus ethanolidurans]|uniref:oligosaccharide flippase family protein n=1 Tax=Pediococcus ethanolidurans TaxID=319653 RepID=UPI0021E9A85C|nr:oligosaccharide flippase family protein [Pediococcus ethanolidurans]MCV3324655.1 oligosaccharide flippase family protein [Pediococcus ethanolidurans]